MWNFRIQDLLPKNFGSRATAARAKLPRCTMTPVLDALGPQHVAKCPAQHRVRWLRPSTSSPRPRQSPCATAGPPRRVWRSGSSSSSSSHWSRSAAAAVPAQATQQQQPQPQLAVPPDFERVSPCGRWRIRPVSRESAGELRSVVALQSDAFYEGSPVPFMSGMFKTFFTAEVTSATYLLPSAVWARNSMVFTGQPRLWIRCHRGPSRA